MGINSSHCCKQDDKRTGNKKKMFQRKCKAFQLELAVAHYTPSSFPIIPMINKKNLSLCKNSWDKITKEEYVDSFGIKFFGITRFYDEFYERLRMYDSSGKFEAVLTKHSSGGNNIAVKGSILLRIINFVLKIEEDNIQTQRMMELLGKSHSRKHIRPWQYSVFVQTLLLTISSRLGTDATLNVMEAWVNLFAFVMKSMLPHAIQGKVDEDELYINTSSEFSYKKAKVEEILLEDTKNEEQSYVMSKKTLKDIGRKVVVSVKLANALLPMNKSSR